MNTVTAGQSLFHQTHTVVFYSAAVICLVMTQLPLVVKRGESFARRCYWGGTAGAAVFTVLGSLPHVGRWRALGARRRVQHDPDGLFRDLVHQDRRQGVRVSRRHDEPSPAGDDRVPPPRIMTGPPDSYGTDVTATRRSGGCWFLPPRCAQRPSRPTLGASAAMIGLESPQRSSWLPPVCGFGVNDARWNHPVARKQYVQFGLVAVVTVGVFTVCYLACFASSAGAVRPKRSPSGRCIRGFGMSRTRNKAVLATRS